MSLSPERIAEIKARAEAAKRQRAERNGQADDITPREPDDELELDVQADPPPNEPAEPSSRLEHSGQVRMAYRLAHTYRDGCCTSTTSAGTTGTVNAGHRTTSAQPTSGAHVLNRAGRVARRQRTSRRYPPMRIRPRHHRGANNRPALKSSPPPSDDLDADPWLLNYRQRHTRPPHVADAAAADPSDRITKVCQRRLSPTRGIPRGRRLGRIPHDVLPDKEVRDYLQRLTGCRAARQSHRARARHPDRQRIQRQKQVLRSYAHALGDYAHPPNPNCSCCRQTPTRPAKWIYSAGASSSSRNQEDRHLGRANVKSLTGGDPIKARHMRQEPIVFHPATCRCSSPTTCRRCPDDSVASGARLRVIPFDVFIPERRTKPRSRRHAAGRSRRRTGLVAGRLGRIPETRARRTAGGGSGHRQLPERQLTPSGSSSRRRATCRLRSKYRPVNCSTPGSGGATSTAQRRSPRRRSVRRLPARLHV